MKLLILSVFVFLSFSVNAQNAEDDAPISTAPASDEWSVAPAAPSTGSSPAASSTQNPLLPNNFHVEVLVPPQGQSLGSDYQPLPENIRNALRLRSDINFDDDDYQNMRFRVLPVESPRSGSGNIVERVRGFNFDMCDGPWECTFTDKIKLRNNDDRTVIGGQGSRSVFRDPARPAFCYPGSGAPKEACRNSVRGLFITFTLRH